MCVEGEERVESGALVLRHRRLGDEEGLALETQMEGPVKCEENQVDVMLCGPREKGLQKGGAIRCPAPPFQVQGVM